jgi:hypothetical protein
MEGRPERRGRIGALLLFGVVLSVSGGVAFLPIPFWEHSPPALPGAAGSNVAPPAPAGSVAASTTRSGALGASGPGGAGPGAAAPSLEGSPALSYCDEVPIGGEGPLTNPLDTVYNTSVLVGSPSYPYGCALNTDLGVDPSGSLSLWGPESGILVNASLVSNETIFIDIAGSLTVGHGASLVVNPLVSARIVVQGTVTLLPQGNLTLSPTSSLILDAGSRLVVDGGVLYTEGPTIEGVGGSIAVTNVADEGAIIGRPAGPENSHAAPLTTVSGLSLTGPIGSFTDDLSSIHFLNSTGSIGTFSVTGFQGLPAAVQNLSLYSVGTFEADEADLSGVTITSATTVDLGSPRAVQDGVMVNGMAIGRPLQNLSISHAVVDALGISSADRVVIVNSTLLAGASSVTQANDSFTANLSSNFRFPLDFFGGAGNVPWVNLTNITASAISVQGNVDVSVYNWATNTTLSGGTASLSTISTSSTQVAVHVYRYVLVKVTVSGSNTLPVGTSVSWCPSSSSVCTTALVGPQGTVGFFLLTDVVSSNGVDAFAGSYTISVTATGYPGSSTSVTLTSDDEQVSIQLTPSPPLPPQFVPIFLAEVAGIGVVVAATVYLRTRIRRVRKPRTVPKGEGGTTSPGGPRPKGGPATEEREGKTRPAPVEWKGPGP